MQINTDFGMADDLARDRSRDRSSRRGGAPLKIAIAVAVLGVLGMLIVDHGPWNKPKVQPAHIASYSTTGEAARAVGAKVMPTEPSFRWSQSRPCRNPFTRRTRRHSRAWRGARFSKSSLHQRMLTNAPQHPASAAATSTSSGLSQNGLPY